MNCTKCGRSALGVVDGNPYCERKECCDWKAARLRAQQQRDAAIREFVAQSRWYWDVRRSA